MSDNVPITAGTGTSIATDDCGAAGHTQIVKLAMSGDGSATLIGADSNGLDVDVTRIQTPVTTLTAEVSASGTISAQNSNPNSGTATANSTVAIASFAGLATAAIQLTGTWNGNLQAQGTIDGTNWVNLALIKAQGSALSVLPGILPGLYSCDIAGLVGFRISANASGTGSSVVSIRATAASNLASIGTIGAISGAINLTSGQGYPVGNEDVASTDGDAGMKMLVVRKATPANTSGTDGDYEYPQMSNGRLWVSGDNSGLVSTNNSSATPLGSGATFTGTADDLTDYAAVTVYVFANIASATDGCSIQQSSDGTNWDHLDVYTVPASTGKSFHIQAAAKFLRVVYTNSGSAQGSFRLQTILHKNAPRGSSQRPQDARTNDNDMEEVLAYPMVFNGTTWDRARGTAVGDVAHGATNSGNPVLVGREAIAHGTNPTAVTAGQRTKAYANRAGIPFVMGGHPNIQTVRLNITTAVTDTAVVTVATGLKIVVTSFMFTLDNASTVFPKVTLGFGTANTPTTTGVIGAHGGVPGGGGFGRGDGSGIIGVGADNEDLRVTTVGAATGNGLDLVVTYHTIES